jgi:cell fate (sporulation/competence/biofilm development) regulator YlbF (YheA/YmcA/DUF963 family)
METQRVERDRRSADRYLVIVPTCERSLYEYLRRRFAPDPKTEVLIDRRRVESPDGGWDRPERRVPGRFPGTLSRDRVVVVRKGPEPSATPAVHLTAREAKEAVSMQDADILNDRQRVDRWLEESQYLIGRLIPGFLDDRERLKAKMDSAEQDAERLRAETTELRKEIAALQSEVQYHRAEQAAAADALAGIMDHLSQLQKPASDLYRRLQSSAHTPSSEVHA